MNVAALLVEATTGVTVQLGTHSAQCNWGLRPPEQGTQVDNP